MVEFLWISGFCLCTLWWAAGRKHCGNSPSLRQRCVSPSKKHGTCRTACLPIHAVPSSRPKTYQPCTNNGLITESLLDNSDTQLAEDRAARLDRDCSRHTDESIVHPKYGNMTTGYLPAHISTDGHTFVLLYRRRSDKKAMIHGKRTIGRVANPS